MKPPPVPVPALSSRILGSAFTPITEEHDEKYGVPTLAELGELARGCMYEVSDSMKGANTRRMDVPKHGISIHTDVLIFIFITTRTYLVFFMSVCTVRIYVNRGSVKLFAIKYRAHEHISKRNISDTPSHPSERYIFIRYHIHEKLIFNLAY